MQILILSVLLSIACAVIWIIVFTVGAQIKADYRAALHFTRQFIAGAQELHRLPEKVSGDFFLLARHVDDPHLARSLSRAVREGSIYRYKDTMYPSEYTTPALLSEFKMDAALKNYISALSYYDHLGGGRIRARLSQPDSFVAMVTWLFVMGVRIVMK
jgi:hypothetical protein